MQKKYILALDQGTTSSRSIIFDERGAVVSTAQKEFTQFFPLPGRVEHSAEEIWATQIETAFEAIEKANLKPAEIAALGITNQRETTVVWERATGRPVSRAIVWQDRRTADFCDELRREGLDRIIKQKTGLVTDAYFSATKLRWILNNVEGARRRAEKGELCFGTIDSWLLWNLTGGREHATDVSNASRTMLCNIHNLDWDEELLKIFDIPHAVLPEIRASSEIFGETTDGLFDSPIPIAGMAGDQQSALFGQMCTESGMVKNTYGTGCFMLMNTGRTPFVSDSGLLTTVAWRIGQETTYALEGSVFIGGAVVQWLRDGLKLIESSADIERLARNAEDHGGVFIVPAFAGLGTPHWNQDARGTIVGLTRGSTDAHLARAALDSIAFQTMEVLRAMENDSRISIAELRVDGGATVNDLLMQFQADVLNTKVVRPKITETTALGAAYLSGLAVGFWEGIDDIRAQWQIETEFLPKMDEEKRQKLAGDWQRAVKAAKAWTEN